jgi:hypothetical protein
VAIEVVVLDIRKWKAVGSIDKDSVQRCIELERGQRELRSPKNELAVSCPEAGRCTSKLNATVGNVAIIKRERDVAPGSPGEERCR